MSVWTTEGACGLSFGGNRPADAPNPMSNLCFAPPYPGATKIPPALVPEPPLLDPTDGERVWAHTLMAAYRGAVESRTKKRCFVLVRGDLMKSKYAALLVAAARKLIEHKIAPAAWCAWSVDVWRNTQHGSPPLGMVFGLKRIDERRGWFHSELQNYAGGLTIYGKTYRALLKAWTDMAGELYRLRDSSKAPEVVERYFPGRRYEDLVAAAREEAAATTRRLREAAERGVWLW